MDNLPEFDLEVSNGVAYYNEDSKIVVTVKDGEYSVLYDNNIIASGLGDMDAEEFTLCDAIIDSSGVIYNSGDMSYSSRLGVSFPEPPLVLYKATNDLSNNIPGYMAAEYSDIEQYLPGGTRNRHYGGKYAVSANISKVERLDHYEFIDSANFGLILVLQGTPAVIDLGENDGIIVLQMVQYQIKHDV